MDKNNLKELANMVGSKPVTAVKTIKKNKLTDSLVSGGVGSTLGDVAKKILDRNIPGSKEKIEEARQKPIGEKMTNIVPNSKTTDILPKTNNAAGSLPKNEDVTSVKTSPKEDINKAKKYQYNQFKNSTKNTNLLDQIKAKLQGNESVNKDVNAKVSLPEGSTPNDFSSVYEKITGKNVKTSKKTAYQDALKKIAENKRTK